MRLAPGSAILLRCRKRWSGWRPRVSTGQISSLPELELPAERATPETGAKPVDTEEDARQTRTLHTSGAAAAVGMAAAGVVIATGGAAAPAVAAAVVGGGLAGGAAFALSSASNEDERMDRERRAASGELVLSVRAPTADKQAEAAEILRGAGGVELSGRSWEAR